MGRETCAAGVRGAETSEFTRCFHIGMFSQTNDCLSLLAGLCPRRTPTHLHPAVVPIAVGRDEKVQRYSVSSNIVLMLRR